MKKKFVLLSKIAKEKKYAQEYLGLLARRGDIGSIRIGKRWYTTREWFSEFLADAEAKKTEMKNAKSEIASADFNVSEKIEIAKVFSPIAEKVALQSFSAGNESENNISVRRENVQERKLEAADLKKDVKAENFYAREENISVGKVNETKIKIIKAEIEPIAAEAEKPIQTRNDLETVDLARETNFSSSQAIRIKNNSPARPLYVSDISSGAGFQKTIRGKITEPEKNSTRRFRGFVSENASSASDRQKVERQEASFREWKYLSKDASPNFTSDNLRASMLQKFAYSAAAVLLLVLIFQFGLVFKNDIKRIAGIETGVVAGDEDSKVGLSAVKDSSLGYLANQEGKVRENISLSRVLVRAAVERENAEIKVK